MSSTLGADIAPVVSKSRTLTFTSIGHFMNDGMVFFVPVVADILAKNHRTSPMLVTAILTVFYVASAAIGLVVGRMADRIGKRGLLVSLGIFILSLGLLIFYLSLTVPAGITSDTLAIIAAVMAGIGSSFYHPLGGSIIQLIFDIKSRGKALGINGAFGSLGRALYPSLFFIVAALAISKTNTVMIFAVLGILVAAAIAYGIGRLPNTHASPARIPDAASADSPDTANPADTVITTNQAATTPTITSQGALHSADTSTNPTDQVNPRSIKSIFTKSVIVLTIISFMRSMAFIGIVSWVPIYLTTQKHLGVSSQLGYTMTIMFAGGILGQPFFGQMADRFDKRIVLALNSIGSALSIFAYISFSGAGSIVSLVFFGFFTFSSFPLLMSMVSDYVPRESFTTGNAIVWGLGSTGGQALGPLVVGLLTFGSYSHLGTAFIVMAIVAIITVLATPLMKKVDSRTKMAIFG